jgi:hypothetical protein
MDANNRQARNKVAFEVKNVETLTVPMHKVAAVWQLESLAVVVIDTVLSMHQNARTITELDVPMFAESDEDDAVPSLDHSMSVLYVECNQVGQSIGSDTQCCVCR